MKKNIQPQVYTDAVVTCACGNSFTTTSTQKAITVEICGSCHPFYTGQQRFVDTEGRIDKFTKKLKLTEAKKVEEQARKAAKVAKKDQKAARTTSKSTLKDLFRSEAKKESETSFLSEAKKESKTSLQKAKEEADNA